MNYTTSGNRVIKCLEVRAKISAYLKGRKASEQTKFNMAKGSKKKVVYCYDFDTKLYVTEFESLR